MAANLTSKKQSDLRVAGLRGGSVVPAVALMPTPELLAQARALVERFGGVADRLPGQLEAADVPVLADVLPMFDLPSLPVDGETCLLDSKGRFSCAVARTLLGWEPQDLVAHSEGHWVVLTPAGQLTARRCTPRLNASDKVTLPAAQRRLLGVAAGRKVYVQPLPDANALALVNPAALLLGAPLSLLA